ncbi:unnamed protein product [Caenorhabditis auriculariae]|uniref:Uncharacterized protein n=1 Tax=Caenorhabditis auriculariae TaxID=2777116 RepID=A0A8S1H4S8_9PELO|nr:unnamed protein product [Caenorhabditis auriculariae]
MRCQISTFVGLVELAVSVGSPFDPTHTCLAVVVVVVVVVVLMELEAQGSGSHLKPAPLKAFRGSQLCRPRPLFVGGSPAAQSQFPSSRRCDF